MITLMLVIMMRAIEQDLERAVDDDDNVTEADINIDDTRNYASGSATGSIINKVDATCAIVSSHDVPICPRSHHLILPEASKLSKKFHVTLMLLIYQIRDRIEIVDNRSTLIQMQSCYVKFKCKTYLATRF